MRLDVVIPAYNEEARIDRTLRAYRERCSTVDARFFVALDRCTDGTAEVVRRHMSEDARVRLLEFPKLGKGGVIMETFRHCSADLVGFVDADCATPPAELVRLAEVAEHADGAIATRRHPTSVLPGRRPLIRRLGSVVFAWLVRVLFRLPFADTQCGAKVFRRQAIERMLPYLSSRDLLFDVDLLLVASAIGCRVVEVPTVWIDREGSRVRAFADSLRMAVSATRLWLHHRVLPIHEARDHPPGPGTGRPGPAPRRRPSTRGRTAGGAGVPDVAMISLYPPPGRTHAGRGGVASYAANLCHALAGSGARVTVIAPFEDGVPTVTSDGPVRVERTFGVGALSWPAAAAAARRTGAPVVHAQHELSLFGTSSSAGFLPALAGLRAAGRAALVTMHHCVDPSSVDAAFANLHGLPFPSAVRAAVRGLNAGVARLSSDVIVHDPCFAALFAGATVVSHGIEDRRSPSRDESRRTWQIGREGPVVACVGFLAPYKGLELVLEAAELAGDAVEIIVAGGDHPRFPGYGERLRRRWPAARYTGYVPEADLSSLLAAADVCVFAYPRPCAASGALALALGAGAAVAVSAPLARSTSLPAEVVLPGDAASLAKWLIAIGADPGMLDDLRHHSRRAAAGRSWTDVAARHLLLYSELTDGQRPSRRCVRAG